MDQDEIRRKIADLEWLVNLIGTLSVDVQRIVDVGCIMGKETIALYCCFKAQEAIGLDINENSIRVARSDLEELRQRVQKQKLFDQLWWEQEGVNLFGEEFLQDANALSFQVSDISVPTNLPSNHYDLAYSRYTLHHVWLDLGFSFAESAIREIKRLVRPGGLIAIDEPVYSSEQVGINQTVQLPGLPIMRVKSKKSPEQTFNWKQVFETVGLEVIYEEPIASHSIWLVGRKTQ